MCYGTVPGIIILAYISLNSLNYLKTRFFPLERTEWAFLEGVIKSTLPWPCGDLIPVT